MLGTEPYVLQAEGSAKDGLVIQSEASGAKQAQGAEAQKDITLVEQNIVKLQASCHLFKFWFGAAQLYVQACKLHMKLCKCPKRSQL